MREDIRRRIEMIEKGEVPEGYKKNKIGIMPEEWNEVKFSHKFERISRRNTDLFQNVLTISSKEGLISQEDFFNKSLASENKGDYYVLFKGEFAYNKSYSNGYPYGAIKQLTKYEKGIVSPLYICFGVKNINDCTDFYCHYFEMGTLNREIKAFAQEGARNHGLLNISISDFFNMNMCLPSKHEQIYISQILGAYDKKILLLDNLIKEKIKQKKWLAINLMTGSRQLLKHKGTWKHLKLRDISKRCLEKNKNFKYTEVFSNSAQNGIIPQDEQFSKDIANDKNIDSYYVIHENEFVYNPRISTTAPCGPINMNCNGRSGIMSPLYTVFKITDRSINLEYIRQYFLTSIWFKYMKSIANYGARYDRMNISNDDLFLMPILVPCKELQDEIVKILIQADKEIELLEQQLGQIKLEKKAMMQLLLTGIVRVNQKGGE